MKRKVLRLNTNKPRLNEKTKKLNESLTKEKKSKILFYCDKPACFTHYIANHKLKEMKKMRNKTTFKEELI